MQVGKCSIETPAQRKPEPFYKLSLVIALTSFVGWMFVHALFGWAGLL